MIARFGVAALAAALVWAVLSPAAPHVDLAAGVRNALAATGAGHPVTAVLLGFRAYDTLLEVFVVLVALLAAGAAVGDAPPPAAQAEPANPVLRAFVNALAPAMLLIAGYFLWAGAAQPGGAFQAGTVLAATGVLLRLAGVLPPVDPKHAAVRIGLAAGLALFLGALFLGALPRMLLAVEALLTVSIALALYCLFATPRR